MNRAYRSKSHQPHRVGGRLSSPAAGALLVPLLVLFGLGGGCGRRPAPSVVPRAAVSGSLIERGTASWYGAKFHGRTTASGERFDMYRLTAAHPTLPFGVRVRVLDRSNGRSVVVRINDRGPFIAGRVIDLSYAAARALEMVERGLATVEIYLLE